MPASNPRVSAVVDDDLLQWLKARAEAEGRSVSTLVREILVSFREEAEERFWVREGEARLSGFERAKALTGEDAWE